MHSDFSMLDGLAKVDQYVERAVQQKMDALALTDHGNISGAVEFYTAAKKAGIKPILGQEFYFVPDAAASKEDKNAERFHLTVLALDRHGFETLAELSSEAHRNFYYKPVIDYGMFEHIDPGDRDHLAILSGCAGSILSQKILQESAWGIEEIKWWKRNFLHFYVEVMHHDNPIDKELNNRLLALARSSDTPFVITNDPHYVKDSDCSYHDALLAIQTASDIDDPNRFRFEGEGYHLRNTKEMKHAFRHYPEWVWSLGAANTRTIAEIADIKIPEWESRSWHIPKFPGVDDPHRELVRLVKKGLREKGLADNPEYVERAKHELRVFKEIGISSFILITHDLVAHAKRSGIAVGPGRGSVCGTLVGYLIGIHKVDSIRYDLLFERFLNPERPKMPDIDMDFQKSRRDEMFNYAKEKYGEENVMFIAAFQTMKLKGAFQGLGRAFGIDYVERNKISRLLQQVAPGAADYRTYDDDDDEEDVVLPNEVAEQYPELARYIHHLIGTRRATSSHPAGVIIFDPEDKDIRRLIPEMRLSSKKMVAQYDLDTIDALGLMKQDILALRALDTIEDCLSLIEKRIGERPDVDQWIESVDQNPKIDKPIWRMLAKGDTKGVFQMEGAANTRGIREIKPTQFEDIVSCTSMYRAGPLTAGTPGRWIKNRKEGVVRSIHPALTPLLEKSWGEMIYDEQAFEILNKVAGFSWSRVDDWKTAMKKKDPEKMAALKEDAVNGFMSVSNMSEQEAEAVWEMLEKQASYLFNRSHAVAYSLISYITARLKCYYPLEFMTALIRQVDASSKEGKAKRLGYLGEAHDRGFKLVAPKINIADVKATPVGNNSIMFGFQDIDGIGVQSAKSLVSKRGKGYKNLHEVEQVVNEGILKALAKAGCLREFGVKSSKRKASLALGWDFDDPCQPFKADLGDELKMPPENKRCRFPAVILRNEIKQSQNGKPYAQWEVQPRPGYTIRVRLWRQAERIWSVPVGSIVEIKGNYDDKYDSIAIGDDRYVEVLQRAS